jgi:polyferredoxin
MDKMGYDPGLIRYTTEHALAGGHTHWLRLRSVGYATALVAMITAFTWAVLTRVPFEVDVLRERGQLYQQLPDGSIGNQYRLRVLNKSQQPATLTLQVTSDLPLRVSTETPIVLDPVELLDLPLTLSAPAAAVRTPNVEVEIEVCDTRTGLCDAEKTRFLGPSP